ncbi:GTA-gp10 family protein, partial [Rhodovulum sulfidophilum]|uniref:GTA-gp10 family protein n=1 Tax=Rhodovulum sulfidophilum TaxID=35806 RepID=UPI0013899AEF
MAITNIAPKGGIVAEIGGRSRPLILRNAEIERFEREHDLGIFAVLDRLIGRGSCPQARHIRDLVALGLVGGGMPDRAADDIVSGMPPGENWRLRQIAHDLVIAAFLTDAPQKKAQRLDRRPGPRRRPKLGRPRPDPWRRRNRTETGRATGDDAGRSRPVDRGLERGA